MPQIFQPCKHFEVKTSVQLALTTENPLFHPNFLLSRQLANEYLAASLQGAASNHIRGKALLWDGGRHCK